MMLAMSPMIQTAAVNQNISGAVKQVISDGKHQIYILSWYELDISDQFKKVQINLYCKNLSKSPTVCMTADSLKLTYTTGRVYPVHPTAYFPPMRIATYDVINTFLRFDIPINTTVDSLVVTSKESTITISLNSRSGSDSIPESNWQPGLANSAPPRNSEKMIRVVDHRIDNNLFLIQLEISNVGLQDSNFNSQYFYLKDKSNIVYKHASVPMSSDDYKPELKTGTLGTGDKAQGWIAFYVGESAENSQEYMVVYDEINGSFLNTGVFRDNIKPYITFPTVAPLVKASESKLGTVVYYNVTAGDYHSNPVKLDCRPGSGSLFGMGETIVRCSAIDAAGNTAQGYFTVTVAESIGRPSDSVLRIDGRNYTITTISEHVKVKGFLVDHAANTLLAQLQSQEQAEDEVTMVLPKEIISGVNLVSINGENVAFDMVDDNADSTSIRFKVPSLAQSIEIRGTQVIPEFGGLASIMIILPVILAIALITTRSLNGQRRIP
jgi:uncharacterized protein DUF4352/HYR domain-containing protein